MKLAALITSLVALGLTIVPPVLLLAGSIDEGPMKGSMIAGAILWFLAWPLANRETAG